MFGAIDLGSLGENCRPPVSDQKVHCRAKCGIGADAGISIGTATLQPNQFSTSGLGWDKPADLSDPDNNAKNRRVEIKVYPAEAPAATK